MYTDKKEIYCKKIVFLSILENKPVLIFGIVEKDDDLYNITTSNGKYCINKKQILEIKDTNRIFKRVNQ